MLLVVSACAGWAGEAGRVARVCAAQPASRLVPWRYTSQEALARVEENLSDLAAIVQRAGASGCDVLAFPEDTLGLLHWEMGNKPSLKDVLPQAVRRMVERLGQAAAAYRMYLVCSSDVAEEDGVYRNAAFFLGRDGRLIGRYDKVQPTITESDRRRGESFPVFETPDLGGVGMAICYDMVMPETTRALALNGADIVFVVTMGGAVTSSEEGLSRAAFRVRAADNYIYLAVAARGGGAMIVSPKGRILAEAAGRDAIAVADIDVFGGRDSGDALNRQSDMRARLFRERNPAAYGILTAVDPPVLRKIPAAISNAEAVRIGAATLTIGGERFDEAEALLRSGKTAEAAAAFEQLRRDFPGTWIDRVAAARLDKMRAN